MSNHLRIIETEDGSPTLFNESLGETYHSRFGAVQESVHVFIEMGLLPLRGDLRILEVGFGTGLNGLLTLAHTGQTRSVHYVALETSVLGKEIFGKLDYHEKISGVDEDDFYAMHESPWEEEISLRENFKLEKRQISLQDFVCAENFDLIYFDAFAPEIQPEMWEIDVFEKLVGMMNPGALQVTYCAKGQVRRDWMACGLEVERLEGPPGKRHMLRGKKPA